MTIDKKMERAGILILYVFILLLSYLSPSALVFAEAVSAKADLRLEVDLQELKEKLPSELNSESGEIILLEFILEEEGQELQRKTMALDHETAPKGKITFENLELSSAQVKIETYEATQFTRQDEKLSYVLRLKKAGDGMVLEGPEGVQISVLNTETPSKEASVAEKEVTDPNSQAAEDAQAKLHSEREKETPKLEKGDKIPEKGEEISKEGEKAPKKEEEKASEKGEKTTETPKGKVEKNPSTVEEKTQVEEKTPLEESNPKEEKRPLEGALGLLNRAKELLFKSEEEAVEAPPSLEIGDFAPVSAVGKGNSSETITVPLGETEKDGEKYYLSFDLSRPEFSVYENIHAVYSNHFSSNQKYSEFFDFENWGLKDFQVEHKLHIDLNGERRSISKYMTYTAESCSWDGVASFDFSDKIEVNSNSLNVVYYYQTIDGKPYYFHPYLLTYDLYLTEENGELTLKIPRLYETYPLYWTNQ
ncbi:MAG: hypothetical protein Q4E76_05850 [Tissierellia bacterium]|nr:hypothetical protein [Tissierellia bacterium]